MIQDSKQDEWTDRNNCSCRVVEKWKISIEFEHLDGGILFFKQLLCFKLHICLHDS